MCIHIYGFISLFTDIRFGTKRQRLKPETFSAKAQALSALPGVFCFVRRFPLDGSELERRARSFDVETVEGHEASRPGPGDPDTKVSPQAHGYHRRALVRPII